MYYSNQGIVYIAVIKGVSPYNYINTLLPWYSSFGFNNGILLRVVTQHLNNTEDYRGCYTIYSTLIIQKIKGGVTQRNNKHWIKLSGNLFNVWMGKIQIIFWETIEKCKIFKTKRKEKLYPPPTPLPIILF